jgi:Domain of unknown function (DUF5127)/Domain of unknown function (DUF4965)/Domain of unknown function (DUF1793)/Domain of unknown function (DUF4964)/TAT (twin-arginine translocation) pathway signal sequence
MSETTTPDRSGTSRRNFLRWSAVAGAGAAAVAATGVPTTTASAETPAPAAGSATPTPSFDPLRAPAVPLAVRSPYLSTWLAADSLPGTWPTFWTGHITALTGIASIDGTAYVFMGSPTLPNVFPFPTMRQTASLLTATSSHFVLAQAGVQLDVTFLSPVEPGDLRRQSMPLSYVTVAASSLDGATHRVRVYLDISGEWATNDTSAQIVWDQTSYTSHGSSLVTLSYQLANQQQLAENGELASWGTIALSTEASVALTWQIGQDVVVRQKFVTDGVLAGTVDADQPRAISDRWPVFAFAFDLGSVGADPASGTVSLGHVRAPAVSYLGTPLPPLWMDYFSSPHDMIGAFHIDYTAAVARNAALDNRIKGAATRAGGEQYAALCALALRQAYGGTELVSRNGTPWAFLKEISSDGNVSTVDVTYPCMPVFLYADPQYLGLILGPLLDYAEHGGWPKQFAEHDLGSHYPNATGHNDGNEEDMPVEESANMLIMSAAYGNRLDATAAGSFAQAHYSILKQWADYLVANALDPGFQNQTDDFTGFIAHSVNLALKGIVGIGAMSQIATAAGNPADSAHYLAVAKEYIGQWVTMAMDSSGLHLKLAYDQGGTWSLKYNGLADKILGLGLVPSSVAATEAAWYLKHANTYGVPLDVRHTYTKGDWELWTAGWLADHQDASNVLIESVYEFANSSPSRVAMTDWYDTVGDRQNGFQARPVVGGFYSLLALPSD